MQLDFAFLKFAKKLKNCSPTVLHLTYAFCQTWHLMNQTWYFCIGTMVWHFDIPRILDSLSCPYSPCRGSFPRYESSRTTILFPPRVASFFLRAASFLRTGMKEIHRRLLFLQRREARRSMATSSPSFMRRYAT